MDNKRVDGRGSNDLRPLKITRFFQHGPAGSVLIELGNTKVICAATVEQRVPTFRRNANGESKGGWLKAEYTLLPSATATRTPREAVRGKQNGRTHEIQRLIGRSLRSVLDLKALGDRTITIDCDVIEADGGTRTASVTGAFIALVDACESFYDPESGQPFPVKDFLAAVSVGMVAPPRKRIKKGPKIILAPAEPEEPLLDLCYAEDSQAAVDMNVVMTGNGEFVELQGTGEGRPFTLTEHRALIELAAQGIDRIISYEKDILGNHLVWRIGREG